MTFGVGTNLKATCDASVVLCVSVVNPLRKNQKNQSVSPTIALCLVRIKQGSFIPIPILSRAAVPPHMGNISLSYTSATLYGSASMHALAQYWNVHLRFRSILCHPSWLSREFQLIFNGNDSSHAVGCHVFLKWYFATPITVWAAIINSYILVAFMLPLKHKQITHDSGLRRVCRRSIWSAAVSGIATVINLSVLLILKGEHGIECLLCCSIDGENGLSCPGSQSLAYKRLRSLILAVSVNAPVLALVSDTRGETCSFPSLQGDKSDNDANSGESPSRLPYERKASGHSDEESLDK